MDLKNYLMWESSMLYLYKINKWTERIKKKVFKQKKDWWKRGNGLFCCWAY